MPRTLTIGLAQTLPRIGKPERNIVVAERLVGEHRSLDMMIFPELYLAGYTTRDVDRMAVDLDNPLIDRLARAAQDADTALIVGLAERRPDGIANSAICIDRRGQLCGVYRKVALFGDERGVFAPGQVLRVVGVDGVKIGLMICFDLEFPEIARRLALAGADLLVTISANMTPFGLDHRTFTIARAIENGRPHVYVNQVGEGDVFQFTGGSIYVSADGQTSAEAGGETETISIARVVLPGTSTLRPDYLALLRSSWPQVQTDD